MDYRLGRMKVTVLFFAAVREIAGESETIVVLPDDVRTVRDLALHLEATVPGLEGRLGALRWAKNEEFVGLDAPLEEGDVVAAIPPVAGGAR
jgi:molybdopterin converting factor subunit 1